MENPNIESPAPAQQVAAPAPVQAPTPTPAPTTHESGGVVGKIGDFKIVEYFTFSLVIASMIYSIFYHRQALMSLKKTT